MPSLPTHPGIITLTGLGFECTYMILVALAPTLQLASGPIGAAEGRRGGGRAWGAGRGSRLPARTLELAANTQTTLPPPTARWRLVAAIIQLVLVLVSGFAIIRPALADWLVWLYWANPAAWAFRAVVTNEFLQARWDYPLSEGLSATQRAGDVILQGWGMWPDWAWVWSAFGFLAATYALLVGATLLAWVYAPEPRQVASVSEEEAQGGGAAATVPAAAAEEGAAGAALKLASLSGKGDSTQGSEAVPPELSTDIPFQPVHLVFR